MVQEIQQRRHSCRSCGLALVIFSFSVLFKSSFKNTASTFRLSSEFVELTLIRSAKDRGAFCLDGSLPGYHFEKGFGSGSSNWVLHIEGGGWCDSIASCLSRKTTALGSSHHMELQVKFSGILSHDPAQNPDFFNWNKVKIRYCDGASFAGNPESEFHNGTNLSFRGQLIWEALMDELLSIGMSNASQDIDMRRGKPLFLNEERYAALTYMVGMELMDLLMYVSDFENLQIHFCSTVMSFNPALLSGCSAGGLAAMIHCDDFRQRLPKAAVVKCLADASFFLDEKDVSGRPTMRLFYQTVVKLHGVAKNLHRDCVAKMDPHLCFFPKQIIGSIKTPIFLVNPAYDFWQIQHVLVPRQAFGVDWQSCRLSIQRCSSHQIEKLHGFRNSLLNALDEFKKNEEGGMFINSCFIHCQTAKETWYGSSYSSKIDNKTIAETVGDWYFNRERGKRVDCPFPCNPSCLNMDFTLPGARF